RRAAGSSARRATLPASARTAGRQDREVPSPPFLRRCLTSAPCRAAAPVPSRLLPLDRSPRRPAGAALCRLTAAPPSAVRLRDHLDVFLFPHCYLADAGPVGPAAAGGA